jgi:hypothetical protein
MCNVEIVDGPARILRVEDEDTCTPKVVVEHAAGCSEFTSMWVSKLMTNHAWLPGVLCLAGGLAISVWGIFFSRYIIAVIGGFLVFIVMGMLMVLYHTPDTNIGRFFLGATVSIAFGVGLKKIDTLGIYFISIVGGLFAGLYVSEIISGLTGWSSFYMMSYVCGVFMVGGFSAGWACKDCCEVGKYTFIWILAHC